MAFTLAVTKVVRGGGHYPAPVKVYGTYTNGGSDTTGTIDASDFTGTAAAGLRKIDSVVLNNISAEKAPKVVKAYDGTSDSDQITITCASGDSFTFAIEGEDVGA